MPLVKSGSRKAVGENIKREMAAGRPKKQAVAIALNVARKAGGHVAPHKIGEHLGRTVHQRVDRPLSHPTHGHAVRHPMHHHRSK